MKTRLSILLLSVLLGLTACSDKDSPVVNTEDDDTANVVSPDEPDYSSVITDTPAFISSSIRAEVIEGLQNFMTNTTSLDQAEIAIVKDDDIGTYDGELLALYQRGGFIIVAEPDGTRFREFASKNGISDALPFDASQDVLLYATSKKREHYVLYSANPFDPEEIQDPIVLAQLEQDGKSYYKRRIFEMCRWLKEQRAAKSRTRGETQFVTQFDPRVLIDKCDLIINNFPVSMNHEVADRKTSKADYISATGSVEVRYTIYSAYVFEGGRQPGDYYIVRTDATVRNGSAFSTFKKKHGLITHWGAGYYMKQFDLSSALIDPSPYIANASDDPRTVEEKFHKQQEIKKQMLQSGKVYSDVVVPGLYFRADPSPATTIGSTLYTSGIDVELNGSLSAGTETLGAFGFSAGYNSSESVEISDITIKVNTDGESHAVSNSYITREIGKFKTPDGHDEKDVEALIPLVARSDFNATSTWCWTVPIGDAVYDSSTAGFMLATRFDYNYASYVHSSDDMFYPNGYHKDFHAINYSTTMMPRPNRMPFGVIALQNNEELSIYNIKIWVQDEHAGEGAPLYEIEGGYGPGDDALCAVPVGTYYLEFSTKYKKVDNPNIIIESRWKISNIKVKNNPEQDAATTKVSSATGVLIETIGG